MAKGKRIKKSLKRGKGKKFNVVDFIILLVNIVISLMLLLSTYAGYFMPTHHRFTAFLGLGFSFLFIANFLFLIYFLIRRNAYFIYSLIFVAISLPYAAKLMVFRTKKYQKTGKELNFVSYNVKNLSDSNLRKDNTLGINKIFNYLRDSKADVIMLQEFYITEKDKDVIINRLKKTTETNYYCYACYYAGQNNTIITLSKYQLLNVKSARVDDRSFAIYCDMIYNNDTIRIINTHLQSLYLNLNEYNSMPQTTEEAKRKSKKFYSKVTNAFCARQHQTDILTDIIKESPYKIILCGDFNDTPNSYTYRKIHHYLIDAFIESGRGFGFTFKELPLLRIDYMFHSAGITSVFFNIDRNKNFSDHDIIIGKFIVE